MEYKVFCMFCLSPVEEGEPHCKVCGANMLDDPGVEMTDNEYISQPRKPCLHCGTPIITYAVACFNCKMKQKNG